MEIYFVRHGQSLGDLDDVHEGRADFPLTEIGEQQAHKLAEWFRNKPIQCIWSSTLKRASRTAEIIQNRTGGKLQFHDDLREWNNGVLAGMNRKQAQLLYPKPVHRKWSDSVPEGESELDFRCRAHRIMEQILEESKGYETILVVAHGGIISRMVQALLQFPLKTNVSFRSGDIGVHHFTHTTDHTVVHMLNYRP